MRTVTVKGTGKVSAAPDTIEVSLTLRSKDKDYGACVKESDRLLASLRKALCKVGFSNEDIKTSGYDVSSDYESERDGYGNYKSVFAGYVCCHSLNISFELDTERLAKVLAAVSDCIAEPELSVRFTIKDKDALCDALLENAAKNAKKKAEVLAEASGVSLGILLSIDYSWGEIDVYSPTNFRLDAKCMAMSEGSAASVTPEDINLSDSVTFVWEMK